MPIRPRAAALITLAIVDVARAQCTTWLPEIGTPGTNDAITSLLVLPGGDVIVGGAFTVAGGVAANHIARHDPITGVWSAMGSGLNGPVNSVVALPNGDLVVGGRFTNAGGVSASGIARYNPTTHIWSALGAGVTDSIPDSSLPVVHSLAVIPDGDVIVGGDFTTAGGETANNIARLNPTTNSWFTMGSGMTAISGYPTVYAIANSPGGDVIIGGYFREAGGVAANNLACYRPATGVWSALGLGASHSVYALAVLPGGDVIAGGAFTQAGGRTAIHVARFNPSTGVSSRLGSGTNQGPGTTSYVSALAVLPGGDVIVGGDFITAGGAAASYIARVNPDTGAWSPLGSGISSYVFSLAVLPGGDVIAGGQFAAAGGVTANNIARCFPGPPAPRLISQPSPQALIPGSTASFAVAGAGTGPIAYQWRKDAVYLSNGGRVSGANTSALAITAVQSSDQGTYDCIVTDSCYFATSSGASLSCRPIITQQPAALSRLDAGIHLSVSIPAGAAYTYRWRRDFLDLLDAPSLFSGANTPTLTILASDPSLVGIYDCVLTDICGTTTSVSSMVFCPTDLDNGDSSGMPDGGVTFDDVRYFLVEFESGNTTVDLDNDGDPAFGTPDNAVDINDLLFFLARFEAGC